MRPLPAENTAGSVAAGGGMQGADMLVAAAAKLE